MKVFIGRMGVALIVSTRAMSEWDQIRRGNRWRWNSNITSEDRVEFQRKNGRLSRDEATQLARKLSTRILQHQRVAFESLSKSSTLFRDGEKRVPIDHVPEISYGRDPFNSSVKSRCWKARFLVTLEYPSEDRLERQQNLAVRSKNEHPNGRPGIERRGRAER